MSSYLQYQQWKDYRLVGEVYLSVVIPVFNEQARIIPTIGAVASHLAELGVSWELIIADDGSRDESVKLVEELGFANLNLVKAPQNEGKGSAVRRGVLAARGKYILFADADNSTPIEELGKLLTKVTDDSFDLAIGSRAANGAQEKNRSLLRTTMSNGLRWLVHWLLQVGVRDTQCGFKLYTRKAARHLHQLQTIDGFSFDLEILYLAHKFGYRIAETPVAWVDAPGSKVEPIKEARRFLRDLIRIRQNDLLNRYDNTVATVNEHHAWA